MIGLCLPVSLSVFFHVLFITPPSAQAEERTPFDPVFAPATGQGMEEIAIPLGRQINETFIRGRAPSKTVVEAPDMQEPDIPPSVQSPPAQPVTSETTPPTRRTGTSNVSSPNSGLIADLLRLFGFSASDDTRTATSDKTAEPDTDSFSAKPPAVQPVAPSATPEVASVVQETEPAPKPKSEAQKTADTSSPDNSGFLQQIAEWFSENTERGRPSNGDSQTTQSVSIDLPPPLESDEPEAPQIPAEPVTNDVSETKQITPEPEIQTTTAAAQTEPPQQAEILPEPENQLQPQPAQPPTVQPIDEPESSTETASVVATEPDQDQPEETSGLPGFFNRLFGLSRETPEVIPESGAPEPIETPPEPAEVTNKAEITPTPDSPPESISMLSAELTAKRRQEMQTSVTKKPREKKQPDTAIIDPAPDSQAATVPVTDVQTEQPVEQAVEAVSSPIPETPDAEAVSMTPLSEPVPEPAVEIKTEPAPESEPAPEPSPQVASLSPATASPTPSPTPAPAARVPTIERKGPEETVLNFSDVVSSFFAGKSVERQQRSGNETPGRKSAEKSKQSAIGGDAPVAVRQAVVVSEPSSTSNQALSTPLVDAAIAEAQRLNIDPAADTAFAVDIAVPVSDTVRIVEEKLILGFEGNLGRAMPFSDDPGQHCLRRLSGRTWICLESLGWPSVIADAFMARGVPEGRTKAIVRYDKEQATQFRVSFPAESFDRIRFHFEYLLGPPNDSPEVWVPLFAEPKRKNRVIRWVAEPVGDVPPAVLEMREIDDIRWMESPDTVNGVVRLYRDGAKPIFSMIMTADLRLIEVRRLGKKEEKVKFTTAP